MNYLGERDMQRLQWRSTLPVLALYLIGIGVVRQVELYAGDPKGEKDCPIRADGSPIAEAAVATVTDAPVEVINRNGTVNDASCLDRTRVFGVVQPLVEEEVRAALHFAEQEGLRVSVAGRRHSMGGQAFFRDALVLDMQSYNRISLDETSGILHVQSGATWRTVLNYLHPRGYSVEAMQAIDILTVGGSVAVNAHGIDHRSGSLASSIRSLRVMLADGSVHEVDRTHEPELFHAVIGGYGLFGVILDVKLHVTENEMYRFDRTLIETTDFPAIFANEIDGDDDYRLMYVHLSTDPRTLLDEAILYTYRTSADIGEPPPPLRETGNVRGARFILNVAKMGPLGERFKWFAQKHVLPLFRQCYVSRNEALREPEACLASRNQALFQSLDALKNKLPHDTDILQEYFIPRQRLLPFLEAMGDVLQSNEATLLNASIRVIHQEDILLNYAKQDMFSVVLYLNQEVSEAGNLSMAQLTRQLIDTAAEHGGTFYLPYQLHYSRAQLERAYPEIDSFFALKRHYDPTLTFMNDWYDRYVGEAVAGGDIAYVALNPQLPDPWTSRVVSWLEEPEARSLLEQLRADPRAPPGSPGGISGPEVEA
jgi:FAD/FMN-containing dehydrogenase